MTNKKKNRKEKEWIPAFAGMTNKKKNRKEKEWIPAFAGMTKKTNKKKLHALHVLHGEFCFY